MQLTWSKPHHPPEKPTMTKEAFVSFLFLFYMSYCT
jgi:hypothetical protein